MSLFHAALQPALDDNGDPLSGAQWFFYAHDSLTPVSVYSDVDLETSLGTTVTANSAGVFAVIFLDDSISYRAVLKTAGGTTRKDIDPINGDSTTVVTPAQFGAFGTNEFDPAVYYDPESEGYGEFTGTQDDTAGMLAFFEYCIETGATGHIPAGNYWVDWGAIDLNNGGVEKGFPVITTAGVEFVRFIGRGETDDAMISITNGTVDSEGIYTWKGGGIYHGFSVYNLDDQIGATSRSAMKLWGIEKAWFGPIFGRDLQGNVLHVPKKTNSAGPSTENPDPYHIYSCTWESVEGWYCDGWVVYNLNSIGLVGCTFMRAREITNTGGGFYGFGANNDLLEISTGASNGISLHDGSDVALDHGVPFNFTCHKAEFDAPAYGVYLNRSKHVRIAARIVHRNQLDGEGEPTDVYKPVVGVQYGAGVTPDADDHELYIEHDIRGPIGGTTKADIGDFFNFSNATASPSDTYINTKIINHPEYDPAPGAADLATALHSAAKVRIELQGKAVLDQTAKPLFSATHSGTQSVPNSGFGGSSSIIHFNSETFDRGADYDATTYGFTAPATGQYLCSISLALNVADGTRVRLGLLEYNNSTYSLTACSKTSYQNSANVQHHQITRVVQLTQGYVYYVTADQNTGGSVDLTPAFNNAESCFQLVML